MLAGHLALITASLFAGAALYINIAEQPARLLLGDSTLLQQWKPAYKRGFFMQASLAMVGSALGVLAWHATSDWRWLAGAVVLVSNWPFTLFIIMPTNKILMATDVQRADAKTRSLIVHWGHLHAVRTALGTAATLLFLWALH